jgi:hypothetical protein
MVLTVVTADGRISEIRAVRANMRDLRGAQVRTAQGFFTSTTPVGTRLR